MLCYFSKLLWEPVVRIFAVNELSHPAYLAPSFSGCRFTKIKVHHIFILVGCPEFRISSHPYTMNNDLVLKFGKVVYLDLTRCLNKQNADQDKIGSDFGTDLKFLKNGHHFSDVRLVFLLVLWGAAE